MTQRMAHPKLNLDEAGNLIEADCCPHWTPWHEECDDCWAEHRRRMDGKSGELYAAQWSAWADRWAGALGIKDD